jgi:hypothetical protein
MYPPFTVAARFDPFEDDAILFQVREPELRRSIKLDPEFELV